MSKVKILALVLAFAFLVSCSDKTAKLKLPIDGTMENKVASLGTAPTQTDADGYHLAASNDNFSLYYEETGLTVKVKNNRTGAVMTSAATPDEESSAAWKNFVNSGIVLEYYKGKATALDKTNMYSGNPDRKISLIENGFAAELKFKKIGIELTMLVKLDEKGIRVEIPNSSVKETNENFHLAAIYVLPFLGYTHLGDVDGYMLIPDGCGALIELDKKNGKFSQPYKSKVYGGNYSVEANSTAIQEYDETIATTADSAEISAPVFGMIHQTEQNGFLGIIESGKYNAEIYAYPNGVVTDYNWITARYIYREPYLYLTGQSGSITSVQNERETFDISVAYRFVGGEDADYVGLAKAYREYLIENKVLNGTSDYAMRLDFFAGDVEKALLGKSFVTMTTVDQIDEILSDLGSQKINKLSVSLKGWQKGGAYGEIKGSTDFQNNVGSFEDYEKLAEKYDGIDFMLYGDFTNTYNKKGSNDYIYQYNGSLFSNESFLELHPTLYRYTPIASKGIINKLMSKLEKNNKVGIAFDGVTDEVYSYGAGEKFNMYTRQYAAGVNIELLAKISKKAKTAYIAPNDYLWASTDNYYDYKIYGSDYKFVSREVPFLAIVLNGSMPIYGEYVNFKADTTEYKLKLIESGVYPSFLLTYESPSALIYTDSASLFSCEYGEYLKMIKEYDGIFKKLSAATEGTKIADHAFENGLAVTSYENGAEVVVNYNETETVYEGQTVGAQSYLLINGKAVE